MMKGQVLARIIHEGCQGLRRGPFFPAGDSLPRVTEPLTGSTARAKRSPGPAILNNNTRGVRLCPPQDVPNQQTPRVPST